MKNSDSSETPGRRHFLKQLGRGVSSVAALSALSSLPAWSRGSSFSYDRARQSAEDIVSGSDDIAMTYRTNRHMQDRVSLLGYGMMRLPQRDGTVDQEMVNQEVDYALAHGVNYFDTAPSYGKSEEVTGIALSRHRRDTYYLATKASDIRRYGLADGQQMLHNSLDRLRTTYIDYYLLHAVGLGGMDKLRLRFLDNGLLDWLCEQRDKGVIRNLGFSYHGDVRVFDYLLAHNDKYHFNFVQIEMNYIDWRHASTQRNSWKHDADAEYLYAKCAKLGIHTVVMEPLLGGRLAKVDSQYAQMMKQIRPGDTPARWALRWVGSHPNVLVTLSGMTTMDVLRENVATFSPLVPCTAAETALLSRLADAMAGTPVVPCTSCRYCMPCPFGVNIPGNFSVYNEAVNLHQLPLPETTASDYQERLQSFRRNYQAQLKPAEWATQCRDCEACLPKCPQQIRIPNQLARIREMLPETSA